MTHNLSNPEQQPATSIIDDELTAPTAIRRLNSGQGETSHFTLEERLGDSYIDRSELKVIKRVGEGGFATVQMGKWKNRVVAIKTLFEEMFADEREVLNFLTEVRLLKKIDHPHIVKFLGAGGTSLKEEDLESPRQTADLFLVQEFCVGGSLKQLVSLQMIYPNSKLYSDTDALRWSIQIATAVDYVHSANPKVVHRDLKLDNCLLTDKKKGQADCKLADFGLAKLFRQTTLSKMMSRQLELSWGPGINDDPLWIKGSVFHRNHFDQVLSATPTAISIEAANLTGQTGSFAYMAPEVVKNQEYDEKADVFSFAMVVYNLFHRIVPSNLLNVNDDTPDAVENYGKEVAKGYRPPIGKSRPINDTLKTLIEQCWANDPRERPSMKEVLQVLTQLQTDGAMSAQTSGGVCCSLM